jgi:hypothetical protein
MYEKKKHIDLTVNERNRMRADLLKEALRIEQENKTKLLEVVIKPLEVEDKPTFIQKVRNLFK